MTPAAVLRRSSKTPDSWQFVVLIDTQAGNRSVRHAITFNRIDAGLRRLAKLGATATEETSLKEALLAGAVLEEWLKENQGRK